MTISQVLVVKGLHKIHKAIGDAELKWQSALAGAVYESGNRIVADSVRGPTGAPVGKYTGPDTTYPKKGLAGGFLRASAYQTYPQRHMQMLATSAAKSFGVARGSNDFETQLGFNAVYAAKVETTARDAARRQYFTGTVNKYAAGHFGWVSARAKQNHAAGRGLRLNRRYGSKYVKGGTRRGGR